MFLIGPGCRGPEVGHGLRQSICQSTHSNKQFYPPDGRVHVWYLLLRNMHDIFLDFAEEEERSGAIEMHPHRFAFWTSLASGVHRAQIIASTNPISLLPNFNSSCILQVCNSFPPAGFHSL